MKPKPESRALTTTDQHNGYELALIAGDLAKLSPDERLSYYSKVCESVGLNPLTQPFAYITLNSKLTLYARKDATDQLRKINGVSITNLKEEERDGVYVVTATAQTRDGRIDCSKGAVNIGGLKGDALANAIMKAETKAKRRVTLSICGLGFLDETEIETIPHAEVNHVEVAEPRKEEKTNLRDKALAILNQAVPQGVDALGLAWKSLSSAMQKSVADVKEELKRQAMAADESHMIDKATNGVHA